MYCKILWVYMSAKSKWLLKEMTAHMRLPHSYKCANPNFPSRLYHRPLLTTPSLQPASTMNRTRSDDHGPCDRNPLNCNILCMSTQALRSTLLNFMNSDCYSPKVSHDSKPHQFLFLFTKYSVIFFLLPSRTALHSLAYN